MLSSFYSWLARVLFACLHVCMLAYPYTLLYNRPKDGRTVEFVKDAPV